MVGKPSLVIQALSNILVVGIALRRTTFLLCAALVQFGICPMLLAVSSALALKVHQAHTVRQKPPLLYKESWPMPMN